MINLAKNGNQKAIQLSEIAKQENISEKYLSQIAIPLKSAGLITSIRGAGGGYKLDRATSQITVKEIVEALEGNLYPVECSTSPENCEKSTACITRKVWKKMGDGISDTLEKLTLENLLEDTFDNTEPFIYTI